MRFIIILLCFPLLFGLAGVSSCSKGCKYYEIRTSVNRWVGGAVKDLPLLLRLDYQYHIPTHEDQLLVYREVTEIFTGKTDDMGKLVIKRNPPNNFASADLKTLKASMVYAAKGAGVVSIDPSHSRQFVDGDACVYEQHYIIKTPVAQNSDFIRKQVLQEQKWAKEHEREIFHNGEPLAH